MLPKQLREEMGSGRFHQNQGASCAPSSEERSAAHVPAWQAVKWKPYLWKHRYSRESAVENPSIKQIPGSFQGVPNLSGLSEMDA